jgi:hypothetical protein
MPLSGPQWVNQFPASDSTDTLMQPFRGNVNRFIAALNAAGVRPTGLFTFRPPERAYLMHYSYRIASQGLDPQTVPAMAGVVIDWVHRHPNGTVNLAASRFAAQQMVQAYQIAYAPVLLSRHEQGRAIDMTISWTGILTIVNGSGTTVTINTMPRNGAGNALLHQVGATYGVIKLLVDDPHWSDDGH